MRDPKVEKAFFDLMEDIRKYYEGEINKNIILGQIKLFETMARNSDDVFEDFIDDIREMI
jgi:hypothetical protein